MAVIISKMRGKRLSVKPSLHQRPPTCWTMWSLRDEQPRRSVDLRAVRGSAVGQEGRDRQTWSPASLDNWSQGWEAQEPPYRKEDRPGLQVQSWPQVREVVSTTAMTGIPAQTQCCPAVLPFHGKQGRPAGSGPERQALASAQAAELAGGELRGRCCFSGALGTDAEPRAGRSHPALGRPGDWPAASRRPEGSGGGGRGAGAWLSEGRVSSSLHICTLVIYSSYTGHIQSFTTYICIYAYMSGKGNGTPLQYSCLENPMEGGAWWAAVHGIEKSRT